MTTTETKEYIKVGLNNTTEDNGVLPNTPTVKDEPVIAASTKESKKTIGEFLLSKKSQIAAALPSHMTPDRMLRLVMTEINRNPDLKDCTLPSLVGAVLQCSQLGLELGSVLGHAYLVVYKNSKKDKNNNWITVPECQFQLGYKGMLALADRSEKLKGTPVARAVYENDQFEYCYGLLEKCHHVPTMGNRGKLICVYVIFEFMKGGKYFQVIPRCEIDKSRDKSQPYMSWLKRGKTGKLPVWEEYYDKMALKTGIRETFAYMPISIELQRAIALDEAADRGQQNNSFIFDNETGEVTNNSTKTKADILAETL